MNMILDPIISSSFFILVILLLRAVFSRKISMRLQYALWLLVAAKLLLFPIPQLESPLSAQRFLGTWDNFLQAEPSGTSASPDTLRASVRSDTQELHLFRQQLRKL